MLHKIYTLPFLLISLLLLTNHSSAEVRDPGTYFFNETFGDFSEELANARDDGKKAVLIMFVMDDCPYCHRMRTTVLNQAKVQDFYRDNFLIFEVDVEGDIEITNFKGEVKKQKEFAEIENRVRATPVFAFFSLDGERITRYIGATTDTDEFLLLGQYVADGIYKDMSFNRYKRAAATQ
jgi:thioredoxin-related protein